MLCIFRFFEAQKRIACRSEKRRNSFDNDDIFGPGEDEIDGKTENEKDVEETLVDLKLTKEELELKSHEIKELYQEIEESEKELLNESLAEKEDQLAKQRSDGLVSFKRALDLTTQGKRHLRLFILDHN